ncbi:MAG: caspase family protein [Deltaproteobacteria bacterium]
MSALLPVLSLVAAAAGPQSFAIVVGENRPVDPTIKPLLYADDDAVLTHQLLVENGASSTLLVRPDPDTQKLFAFETLPERPTDEALYAAVDATFARIRAAREAGATTRFYFVYSGHGDVDNGEGYVALEDGRLTRRELYDRVLSRSPAHENHVIVDACRSYYLVFGRGPGGERRSHAFALADVRERFPNTGFLLSTSSDADSHEWSRYRGGIFSHEVRSALRGAADADLDSNITYAEVAAFVRRANETIRNSRFRPDAAIVPPLEASPVAAALLSWSGDDGVIVPPRASLGHMVLEDDLGVRLADAHPADGQEVRFWGASSRPVYVLANEGGLEYVITEPGRIVLARHLASPQRSISRGPAHEAFRSLFEAPFSRSDVDAQLLVLPDDFGLSVELERPRLSETVASWAPYVAVGALVVGASMTTTALIERGNADMQKFAQVNDRLRIYNGVAVASYAGAAASAVLWFVLTELEE